MRLLLQVISWAALSGCLLPVILYMNDVMTLGTVKNWMLVSTLVWFVTTPVWMDKQ